MSVELIDVAFKRGDSLIFKQVNYLFESGTMTVLRGDSGSGKSSLLRLMAQFIPLEFTGDILVNGTSLNQQSIGKKVAQLGMVFQNPNPQFTMKTLKKEIIFALENISLDYEEIERRISQVVELTNTKELLDREINTLSGGEKQRASLAVVLSMNPNILLLDEPFASIDIASRKQLIELLGELKKLGKTIIISDHDLSHYEGVSDAILTLTQQGLHKESQDILNVKNELILSKNNKTTSFLGLKDVSLNQGNKSLLLPSNQLFETGITTLTGDNGAGKSSLLRALVQQQKYQGKMYLENRRIKKRKSLYQQMTLAVQSASQQFVCLTPEEELGYNINLSELQKRKQEEMLGKLGLTEKLSHSLFHLSEGQKKMIQLITLLNLEKKVLLLDEPFSGLDEKACQLFMDWIVEKSVSQEFIIVSHRLSPLSEKSDHHLHFENQQLMYQGSQSQEEVVLNDYYKNAYA